MKSFRLIWTTAMIAAIVLITGCVKDSPEDYRIYNVIVTYGNHGTATADKKTARMGGKIELTAQADEGYEFEKWIVESGNVIIEDLEANPASFKMLEEDVEIKAQFVIIFPDNILRQSTIPDPEFRKFCLLFDTDGDTMISPEEAKAVKKIDLRAAEVTNISSLEGIQYFINLEYLDCYNNRLESIYLDDNTQLTYLDCAYNKLTSLDLNYNTQLADLRCFQNDLTSLKLENNTQLTSLNCSFNKIHSLDVSDNTQLTYLDCVYNEMTSIKLKGCTQLATIYCNNNLLTSLDLSGNTQLVDLYCNDNKLETLDLVNNTELTGLRCYSNLLTSLDVSKNTKLTTLRCHFNSMVAIIVWRSFDLYTPTNSIPTIAKDTKATFVWI